MHLKDYKHKLMSNPEFKKEYDKIDLAFEISKMIIELRIKKGVTQKRLAELLGTKQPSIARVENGTLLPSITFLDNIAKALGTYLLPPRFACMVNSIDVSSADSGSYLLQTASGDVLSNSTVDVPYMEVVYA
jgi:transcriptional regulator with XRE-family HTH domain